MTILRNVGAVVLGAIVGMVANMALIMVSWSLWPMPEDLDPNDYEALGAYVQTLPAAAFLLVMVAHLAQAGVGGLVAALAGGSRPVLLALIVGAFSMLGGLMNLQALPHPPWMWLEVPLYLVVSWAAGTAVARRRARTAGQGPPAA